MWEKQWLGSSWKRCSASQRGGPNINRDLWSRGKLPLPALLHTLPEGIERCIEWQPWSSKMPQVLHNSGKMDQISDPDLIKWLTSESLCYFMWKLSVGYWETLRWWLRCNWSTLETWKKKKNLAKGPFQNKTLCCRESICAKQST